MKIRLALVFILFCLTTSVSFSQGCSDAGFCTMGSMSPDQNYQKENFKLRQLEVSFYEGKTNLTPIVRSLSIDGTFAFKETNIQIKIPYQGTVKGNLGTVKGRLGDISISATKNLYETEQFSISGTAGTKITTGNSDLKDEQGRIYPMYYQVNLGSHDFILGGSLLSKKWMLATGLQIPIFHLNKNDFTYEAWKDYPSMSYLKKHALSTNLRRGSDVMLRIERDFRYSKFNVNVGILNIYRINKDQILDKERNTYVQVDQTTGFAITGLAGIQYKINASSSLKISYGHKITDREINPDGLTRKHVVTFGYQFKF